jgi:hypothetical protein
MHMRDSEQPVLKRRLLPLMISHYFGLSSKLPSTTSNCDKGGNCTSASFCERGRYLESSAKLDSGASVPHAKDGSFHFDANGATKVDQESGMKRLAITTSGPETEANGISNSNQRRLLVLPSSSRYHQKFNFNKQTAARDAQLKSVKLSEDQRSTCASRRQYRPSSARHARNRRSEAVRHLTLPLHLRYLASRPCNQYVAVED